ncbi:hypothetical protein ACQP2X_17930 [Actinoplanes sp. CA-131856]
MTEPALRLVFEYDGDDVRVVSRQRVEMTIPATGEGEAGLRAELRTADGGVLERRALPPIPDGVEVFSPEPGRTVERAPVDRPSGVFTVLVPDLAGADHLALVDDPGGPDETRRVREIARVSLRDES